MDADAPEEKSIFTFPRGAQAGIFFHEIFEKLDFAMAAPEAVSSLVANGLEKFGYSREWHPHVCDTINSVITTPLASPEGAFNLAGIKQGSWICELEFFFPLQFVTADLMGACLRKWGALYEAADMNKVCASLKFKPVRRNGQRLHGHGFRTRRQVLSRGLEIESSGLPGGGLWTGISQNGHGAAIFIRSSTCSTRWLLNRYLSLRVRGYDYATHFGGVLYVFLRGVSPERGEAVWLFPGHAARGDD